MKHHSMAKAKTVAFSMGKEKRSKSRIKIS